MTKQVRIINLVKSEHLYSNQQLIKAVAHFNEQQNNLHIVLEHKDLDRFLLEVNNNKLELFYVPDSNQRVYYSHPEDRERRVLKEHQFLDQNQKLPDLEPISALNVDFLLTRFGPMFNHNGLSILRAARALGIPTSNDLDGIINCRDKFASIMAIRDLVPVVNSTFTRWDNYKQLPPRKFSYPRITKPNAYTFGGTQILRAFNLHQLVQQTYKLNCYDYTLSQDFIKSNEKHNFDLRVMVINGQVKGSFIRVSPQGAIVSNIAQGGYGIAYDIDENLANQSIEITRRLGLDICGLDFIYNHEFKQWQFLEANATPGYYAYDVVLHKDFAQDILDYAVLRITGHHLTYFLEHELTSHQLARLTPLSKEDAFITQVNEINSERQLRQDQLLQQAKAETTSEITELLAKTNVDPKVISYITKLLEQEKDTLEDNANSTTTTDNNSNSTTTTTDQSPVSPATPSPTPSQATANSVSPNLVATNSTLTNSTLTNQTLTSNFSAHQAQADTSSYQNFDNSLLDHVPQSFEHQHHTVPLDPNHLETFIFNPINDVVSLDQFNFMYKANPKSKHQPKLFNDFRGFFGFVGDNGTKDSSIQGTIANTFVTVQPHDSLTQRETKQSSSETSSCSTTSLNSSNINSSNINSSNENSSNVSAEPNPDVPADSIAYTDPDQLQQLTSLAKVTQAVQTIKDQTISTVAQDLNISEHDLAHSLAQHLDTDTITTDPSSTEQAQATTTTTSPTITPTISPDLVVDQHVYKELEQIVNQVASEVDLSTNSVDTTVPSSTLNHSTSPINPNINSSDASSSQTITSADATVTNLSLAQGSTLSSNNVTDGSVPGKEDKILDLGTTLSKEHETALAKKLVQVQQELINSKIAKETITNKPNTKITAVIFNQSKKAEVEIEIEKTPVSQEVSNLTQNSIEDELFSANKALVNDKSTAEALQTSIVTNLNNLDLGNSLNQNTTEQSIDMIVDTLAQAATENTTISPMPTVVTPNQQVENDNISLIVDPIETTFVAAVASAAQVTNEELESSNISVNTTDCLNADSQNVDSTNHLTNSTTNLTADLDTTNLNNTDTSTDIATDTSIAATVATNPVVSPATADPSLTNVTIITAPQVTAPQVTEPDSVASVTDASTDQSSEQSNAQANSTQVETSEQAKTGIHVDEAVTTTDHNVDSIDESDIISNIDDIDDIDDTDIDSDDLDDLDNLDEVVVTKPFTPVCYNLRKVALPKLEQIKPRSSYCLNANCACSSELEIPSTLVKVDASLSQDYALLTDEGLLHREVNSYSTCNQSINNYPPNLALIRQAKSKHSKTKGQTDQAHATANSKLASSSKTTNSNLGKNASANAQSKVYAQDSSAVTGQQINHSASVPGQNSPSTLSSGTNITTSATTSSPKVATTNPFFELNKPTKARSRFITAEPKSSLPKGLVDHQFTMDQIANAIVGLDLNDPQALARNIVNDNYFDMQPKGDLDVILDHDNNPYTKPRVPEFAEPNVPQGFEKNPINHFGMVNDDPIALVIETDAQLANLPFGKRPGQKPKKRFG